MILDRLTTLRKSKTSIQREGQVRQGRLSVCPKYRKDAKPKSTHRHSPYKLLNTKIRHLSKQRILYIQFSALVKSNARMFNCGDNTHQPLHLHNHYKRTIIPRPTSFLLYNTSITHQSVHRLISQPLEQLYRKTGTKCRNNSTLPCSHYREIKQQQ